MRAGLLRPLLPGVHRPEIMLGVLVVVLGPHGVAGERLGAGELHVAFVVLLRALGVALLLGAGGVLGPALLRAVVVVGAGRARLAGGIGSSWAILHGSLLGWWRVGCRGSPGIAFLALDGCQK